jgi:TP901 family phage tail tape measure protein
MPLGARDIMLVIRARNEADSVLRDVGRMLSTMGAGSRTTAQNMQLLGVGLTAVGVGFIAAGAAAESFFADAVSGAVEYERQTALTLTQVDQVGVSLSDIGDIAKRVAREVPAPFDQMQASLYDIFSSMNVNTAGAEKLLTAFSKAAVAGQVDIQDAGRATIAIMNSFKIPVDQVNHVMDIQFQLVRKGVGTYQEFAEVIGRVTPAAVAAGQTVESMAGMLAFLTRNGLSAAMASTSAARAMELLTKPDTTAALEKIGVHTKDASGNFLQMNDILSQLVYGKGWGKLTGPQLKQAFEDTFGTGSIQARRFFDLAIPNFEQLKGLTDDMSNSAGAMDAAYETMSKTTASRLQELNNRFDIIKVNIGERLMPFVEQLADAFGHLMDVWDGLSPQTQDLIVKIAALAGVIAIVVGAIITIVGVFLIFAGAAAAAGVSLGVVGAVIAGIVITFGLLVAGIYLVVSNWQILCDWFGPKFQTVKDAVLTAWDYIQAKINEFTDWLNNTAIPAVQSFIASVLEQWNMLQAWWGEHVTPIITAISELWTAISDAFTTGMSQIWTIIQVGWDIIQNIWNAVGGPIMAATEGLWNALVSLITGLMTTIWNVIVSIWNGIKGFIEGVLKAIQGIIQIVTGLISGDWGKVWDGIKNVAAGVWDAIFSLISNALGMIWAIISGVLTTIWDVIKGIFQGIWGTINSVWDGIVNRTRQAWNDFKQSIVDAVNGIYSWLTGFPGRITDVLHIDLSAIGRQIMGSFLDGLKSGFEAVKDFVGGIAGWVKDHKGPPSYDARLLTGNGMLIMDSLGKGLDRGWKGVEKQLEGYNPAIQAAVSVGSNATGPVGIGRTGTGGAQPSSIVIQEGAFVFHIDNATQDTAQVVQQSIQAAVSQMADEWAGFNAGAP